MPLVRIDVAVGMPAERRRAVADVVYDSMRSALNIPSGDQFEIIAEHVPANFIVDRSFLGIERSDSCIVIQITLNEGRTVEVKRNFYKTLVDGLQAKLGVRPQDVLINLVEVRKENWSFGNGEAQFAS